VTLLFLALYLSVSIFQSCADFHNLFIAPQQAALGANKEI
jgi:hypothetical protein